ncbi:iron-sulfur cluster biosynthesis family protein [Kroppenstedtia pulmonis]|uniref:Iron-sulfur cluster biosynthesis family protein n=1 Tax=Kroppenstedtia pulmonis TaxID=1380685 RepID=A0A7D3XNB6_9BACL|nr:iron-sulfur cluster biosynthesis family protein [Kroppenstedtia pulmonis]QKG84809.1 iron-sulfur cluster biosynthesis family protein [Kroppenstedtia pulmonis]
MNIKVTSPAVEAIRDKRGKERDSLRLAVVSEGCGCGADIVFDMEWDQPQRDDLRMKKEEIQFLVDPDSLLYFDSEVIVDYHEEKGTFSLKSDSQIYANHIRL